MENKLEILKEILEKIKSTDEGDLIALDEVYSLVEENYQELCKIGTGEIKLLLDNLITFLNASLVGQMQNFSTMINHFVRDLTTIYNKELKLLSGEPMAEPEELEEEAEEIINLAKDTDLLRSFINESQEHLEDIEANILSLETNPLERRYLNNIMRSFHTIKGVSSFLNLKNIEFIAHETESFLEYIMHNDIYIESEFLDLVLDYSDLLKELITSLESKIGLEEVKLTPINKKLIKKQIEDVLDHDYKVIERKKLGEIMIESGQLDDNTLDEIVKRQEALKKVDEPTKEHFTGLGKLLIEQGKIKPKDVAHALRNQREGTIIKSKLFEDRQADKRERVSPTIRVNAQKLDNLLDAVGELVIANTQISHNKVIKHSVNNKLQKDMSHMGRIVSDLQRISMSLRMVQIKQTFQKLVRLVRDLSNKMNKPVRLNIEGEHTEIDRNIVDEIYEPLVHIIRNAIDHGIETPAERKEKDKPKTAKINLKAYHKGGNIIIEIEDDGKGLDKNKILEKAIEKGIVKPDEDLSDAEINKLILNSGFSTAGKVTEVSGRGVGMNIVNEKMKKLRGKI